MSLLSSEADTGYAVTESDLAARREIDTHGRGLRSHAARGVLINSGFQVGLAGIGLLRRVLVAAFLTQAEFGLWGILITTLVTLSWITQVGVADKYIQQNEDDQERAYQKAFTLQLAITVAFFILVAALMPVYAIAYGHMEMIVPGVILAASAPLAAFEAPSWIFYRRMQFVRQRVLSAVDPIAAFAITIALGIAGWGYWALVIGVVAGSVAGSLVATLVSPYRNRLRYEAGTLREYASFSWPLVGLGVSNMLTVQGLVFVANHSIGLAAVGAIGLASTVGSFADRVDGIVSQTIYPAVCAISDRNELLHESFVKSNRVILMWAIPFGLGLALFAPAIVTFVLGEQWRSAVNLLAAAGLIIGFAQIAFNWSIFLRAVNDTKPILIAGLINLITFAFVGIPAIVVFGLDGYIIALAASAIVQIIVRGHFLARLFPGFHVVRHSMRAIAPSIPAVAVVLTARAIIDSSALPIVVGELGLYIATTMYATYIFENRLVREMLGYLRNATSKAVAPNAVTAPQGA
jgi:lipopolysaccharide exporter